MLLGGGRLGGVNKNQRIALGIGLAVFVLSLLFVPWKWEAHDGIGSDNGRTPFWDVENQGGLNAPAMLLDWAIIGILTGVAMLLLKKPKE